MGQIAGPDIDSGYAWVIVFASFALHFQQVAPISTLGIFLIEFADYFDVTKTSLGWIGAFQLSTGYLLGVVIGPISRKIGCRPVVCVGSMLMTSGYLASFSSPSVSFLYVTFGLLTGIGIGCLFTPATIVVQLYFYRRRAFAAAIAISGTAVGVFFWPPFCRWMIDIFTWRGGLIIMAAMQLHGLVFGFLLRPGPSVSEKKSNSSFEANSSKLVPKLSGDSLESDDKLKPHRQTISNYSSTNSSLPSEFVHSEAQSSFQSHQDHNIGSSRITISTGSFQVSHISEDFTPRKPQKCQKYAKFWKYLPWVLFFFGNWLVQSCHVLITVLTPVRANWLGIENHLAALLVSIYGISSGVSRSIMGWIGDRKHVNRLVLFGVSAMIAGASTCVSAFFTAFWTLAIYSFVFGLLAAAYIGLLGAIVVSVFTMDNIAIGTGVMSMTVGFANLVTHPLAGWLVDLSGGYTLVFIVFGLVQIVGGFFILSIALLYKVRS